MSSFDTSINDVHVVHSVQSVHLVHFVHCPQARPPRMSLFFPFIPFRGMKLAYYPIEVYSIISGSTMNTTPSESVSPSSVFKSFAENAEQGSDSKAKLVLLESLSTNLFKQLDKKDVDSKRVMKQVVLISKNWQELIRDPSTSFDSTNNKLKFAHAFEEILDRVQETMMKKQGEISSDPAADKPMEEVGDSKDEEMIETAVKVSKYSNLTGEAEITPQRILQEVELQRKILGQSESDSSSKANEPDPKDLVLSNYGGEEMDVPLPGAELAEKILGVGSGIYVWLSEAVTKAANSVSNSVDDYIRPTIVKKKNELLTSSLSSYSPQGLFQEKAFAQRVADAKKTTEQDVTHKTQALEHAEKESDKAQLLAGGASGEANAAKTVEAAKKAIIKKTEARKELEDAKKFKLSVDTWAANNEFDSKSTKTFSFKEVLNYYLWGLLHYKGNDELLGKLDINFTAGLDDKVTADLQTNLSTVLETQNVQRLGATALKGLRNLCEAIHEPDGTKAISKEQKTEEGMRILAKLRECDKKHPTRKASKALQTDPLTVDNYKKAVEKNLANRIARLGVPRSDPSNYAIIRFIRHLSYEFKVRSFGITINLVLNYFGGLGTLLGYGASAADENAPKQEQTLIAKLTAAGVNRFISHLGLEAMLKNIGDQSDITFYYMLDVLSKDISEILKTPEKKEDGPAPETTEGETAELHELREAVRQFENPEGISETLLENQFHPLFELLKIQGDAKSYYDVITPLTNILPQWQDWIKPKSIT